MDCSTSGSSVLQYLSLFQLMSIGLVMPSNHLVLCCHLLLLPSVFPTSRVYSNELALCIRWPKYWRFIFSISPSNEYSRLISFRIDWFDLLCCTRDSQRSSPAPQPAPQFKSICILYGSTVTSVHDYWKDHGFDYMDLCFQSDVFAF